MSRDADVLAISRAGVAEALAGELKDALAGVRGALQVIGSRLPLDDFGSREAARGSTRRIDELSRLADDIVALLGAETIARGPVDLTAILRDVTAMLGDDPRLEHVHVAVEGPRAIVHGEARLLRRALLDLVGWASVESLPSGTVRIEVSDEPELCRLRIRPAQAPAVLDRFGGPQRPLPIAERVVDLHGGSLDWERDRGDCVLHITLPRGRLPARKLHDDDSCEGR
jgi:signal transduction histidine kinase